MRILITGGSSDIAIAIATHRIRHDDEIIISASSIESLDKTLQLYQTLNLNISGFVFNFENPMLDDNAKALVVDRPVDAIILNAFTRNTKFRRLHELDFGDIQQYIASNVTGNMALIYQLLPSLIANNFGRIVLISSVSCQTGTSLYGAYCAAKSALEGLMLNIAVDYGQDNITANIIRAGLFKTSRTKLFWQRQAYQAKVSKIIPQGAMGEVAQLAESLDPLLSSTSYISGSILNVSGGLPLIGANGLQ